MRAIELLQTKLQRPRLPRRLVPRPRLIERLDQGARGPLTLVCAGAGYGKTTLVSAWLAENDEPRTLNAELRTDPASGVHHSSAIVHRFPYAWLSLDEHDSDLGLFLRYVIAGLRAIFPGACAATSSLLQAPRQPPFDLLAATFINEIASLPQDFILVLDDHHLIGGTVVPDLLSELAQHWPQPLHLVLVSRHMPALPLDGMRAKGLLTEIRARDLRFASDEAAVYLDQALRRPLSPSDIELLERRTEGWIAGLQLASLALRDAEDPAGFVAGLSGLDAEFADYLALEVLSRQPAPILSFLLQTAILDDFCVSLCEAVIPAEDPEWSARRCIDWLERRNLFVASLDSRKEWYRYHQMFRSVLLQRAMAELEPGRIAGMQRHAAAWFAHRGLVDGAVRYALAAGDLELAAHVAAQGLCDALNRDDRPTLERRLSLFADEFIHDRLDLLIVRGFSLFLSWQLAALTRMLPRAAALLEQESSTIFPEAESGTMRGCLALLSAAVAYFGSDFDGAADCSREALTLLPERWSFARSGGMIFQGLAMQARGRGEVAVQLLAEEYASIGDRTSHYALRLLLALCLVCYRQAEDLERVLHTAQKMVEGAVRSRLGLIQAWGHYLAGLAYYQRNELAAAQQCFTKLLDFRYTGNLGALRDGMQRLALIHQIAGEQAEAREMLGLLAQLDLDQFGCETDDTGALRARLWLMSGELDKVAAWADDLAPLAPAPDLPWLWQDPPHLTKVRILLARGAPGDLHAALAILDEFYAVTERTYNVRLKIEVLALRALVLGALGEASKARDALQTAVDLARPGGFLRVFLDLGPDMEEALKRLARQASPAGAAAVRRILAEFDRQATGAAPGDEEPRRSTPGTAFHLPAEESRPLQPLIEPLTMRELEILMLLREPMNAKEIARRLVVEPSTVKRHMANIYGKLDVHTRWAALAKAEALGLISPR